MFLMFPHISPKLRPHHYNKYKNIYTLYKKNKYNKTLKCPTTKQYNVPQNTTKINKNTK